MAAVLDLDYPFSGRCLVRNSPADRVPSHGTSTFASSYAVDFVPVDEASRTAPISFTTFVCPEPADRFVGFGQPLLAPAGGVILAAHDSEPDHHAYRGLPSIGYALTQGRRVAAGWTSLAGNHVLMVVGDVVIALCHLQQGSVNVLVGQHVRTGDALGRIGNSGNSTEPHVHLQAVSGHDVGSARAVPVTFRGTLPRNGEIVE